MKEEGIVTWLKEEQFPKAEDSIFVTEEGIVICFSIWQPSKAQIPIAFNDDGNSNSVNAEQSLNEYLPIFLTDWGIDIVVNDVHFSNVCSLISCIFTVSGNLISRSNEQPRNEYDSSDCNDDGIVISVSNEHDRNADVPIDVIHDGIYIFANDEQPSKARAPIFVMKLGIDICLIWLHSKKELSTISISSCDSKRLTISMLLFLAARYKAVTLKIND